MHQTSITRKINWHIMTRFCLLTVLNHMDRANLVSLARLLIFLNMARLKSERLYCDQQ